MVGAGLAPALGPSSTLPQGQMRYTFLPVHDDTYDAFMMLSPHTCTSEEVV